MVLAVRVVQFLAQIVGAGGANAFNKDVVHCLGYMLYIFDTGGAEGADSSVCER